FGPLKSAIRVVILCLAGRDARATLSPADCKTARVTHVDVADVAGVRGDLADAGGDETREAFVDLATPEAHRDAVVEIEFPGAAWVKPYRGDAHDRFDKLG